MITREELNFCIEHGLRIKYTDNSLIFNLYEPIKIQGDKLLVYYIFNGYPSIESRDLSFFLRSGRTSLAYKKIRDNSISRILYKNYKDRYKEIDGYIYINEEI